MTARSPLVLAILDGWGCRDELHGNAIAAAETPNWKRLLRDHPWTELDASGEAVGLPKGIMGNSEVGHINIGAGRTVPQGIVVIDAQIADGSFRANRALTGVLAHVKSSGGTLHFLGLLSDGKVHSSQDHLEALIDAAIATIGGRYYAMDRDKRWERIEKAYAALVRGEAAHHASTATDALDDAYARDENDEFVLPTLVGEARPMRDGDAVIFFNFRPDRARQIALAFSDSAFDEFPVHRFSNFVFATMTKYEEYFTNPVLFGPRPQHDTFGEVVAHAGLRQLRLAETEKYAHVTYFFNGGREDVFAGEDRILIPSNRAVATYDLAPEMSADAITAAAVDDLANRRHDVIVMNYANADMVGHTGKWEPTITSVEILDGCLGRLAGAVLAAGGTLAITADHGNAEEKIDEAGNALTAHTTNPVPFVLVRATPIGTFTGAGKLGDVATTLLPLLGLNVPAAMTGANLLAPIGAPTG